MQMKEYIKNLRTPIAIVGMGRSGEAAKRLLLLSGVPSAEIKTFDAKLSDADFRDPQDLMEQARPQTLVVSPGVPLASAWIQEARSRGVSITSETSLACTYLSTEKIIGVTGSLGKSTTVSLLGAAAQSFSPSAFVGGNLGTPFCEYAISLLEKKQPAADWVVLELSSYQLENCVGLYLDHSAITYLSPNHLERYKDLDDYYQTKWQIQKITRGTCFLNGAGGDVVSYSQTHRSHSSIKIVSPRDSELHSFALEESALIGQHNLENIAVATSVALGAGWPKSSIAALKNFSGLSHRLENLGVTNGIRFINDSKATALDSVLIATKAAREASDGHLYILLGGRDKNLPWQDLNILSAWKNTSFIFFGECREVAKQKSGLSGPVYPRLGEALAYCKQKAKSGDTVLLSPGGTSLDEFKSFEERGDFFKSFVSRFSAL